MFVIKKDANYYWPVKVLSPEGDGKQVTQTFDAQFKRIPQSRLSALLKDDDATDAGFAREVVVGWRGIVDESKNEVPFSDGLLQEMLELPGVAAAISVAYLESVSQVKRKN